MMNLLHQNITEKIMPITIKLMLKRTDWLSLKFIVKVPLLVCFYNVGLLGLNANAQVIYSFVKKEVSN